MGNNTYASSGISVFGGAKPAVRPAARPVVPARPVSPLATPGALPKLGAAKPIVRKNYDAPIFTGPKITDAQKATNDAFKVNKEAADYGLKTGSVNQFSPYGSVTYTRDANGVPTAETSKLSAPLQTTFDETNATRNALLGTAKTTAATPWALPDTSRASEVEKALYDRKLAMVSPEMDAAQARLDRTLVERGLPVGSEIYDTEMNRNDQSRSNTLASLSQDATLAGGAEEDRLLRNSLAERAQPFNEAAAFAGGTQVAVPQFGATPNAQISAPDYSQLYTNQQTTDQNKSDSFWNGLLGLGKSVVGGVAGGPIGSAVANWLF